MAADPQQGPGWWLASDDKWYPPESHPNYLAPLPPPPSKSHIARGAEAHQVRAGDNVPEAVTRGARRGLSAWAWLQIAVCVVYIVSPLDVVPEVLLGPLGLTDDLIALLIGIRAYRSRLRD